MALALSISPALAEEIQDWAFDTSNNELTFSLSDQIFPEFFLLSEPPRLVLDIPNTEIGNVAQEQIYDGAVQNIRVAQYTPENTRVVIELAPEIVLLPEQADIQFDSDGDGQRRWRFRPLIAESDMPVEGAIESTSANGSSDNISLSAANLQGLAGQVNSTELPIDPYESETSAEVVSVPPLEDLVENVGAVAVNTDTPELPPMTVPELEDIDSESTVIPSVAAVVEPRSSDLPTLEANENTQPEESAVNELIDSESLQSAETGRDVADDTGEAIILEGSVDTIAEVSDVAALAEQPVTAAEVISDPVEANVPAVNESAVEEVAAPSPAIPAEAAIAPVEVSSLPEENQAPSDDGDDDSAPSSQTIQQPAAERTIVQTELPAPLKFGQPLPTGL